MTDNNLEFGTEIKIACGLKHGAAISDTGVFFSWGSNAYGQLAQKHSENQEINQASERQDVRNLSGKTLTVACQDYSTFAIIKTKPENSKDPTESERPILFAWGKNEGGQLGLRNVMAKNSEKVYKPESVFFHTTQSNEYPARIYCGPNYSVMITSPEGRLYTWGNGGAGNLGHDNNDNLQVPTFVKGLIDKKIIMASCGAKHMMALTEENQIFVWGTGENGRLGLGDTKGRNVPTVVDQLINQQITFIACGESHSFAVANSGDTFSWGNGSYYRLGHGDKSDCLIPKQIVQLAKKRVVQVAAGMNHNLAITFNGDVYGWGSPLYGVLGLQDINDTQPVALPRILNRLEGIKVNQIAVGKYHSICCTNSGDIYSWGDQGDYRLGYKIKDNQGPVPFPLKVPKVSGVTGASNNNQTKAKAEKQQADKWKIVQGALGSQHSIVRTEGGNLWVWGEGCKGSLGTGTKQDYPNPTLLSSKGINKIQQICAGEYHTMAINTQGEVFTWGEGSSGQLGTGTAGIALAPVQVESLNGKRVVMGCCGEQFSGVLTDQGDVYTWGDSDLGKLGQGQNVSVQYYPRIIKDLPKVKTIAAGTAHMAAIDKPGQLYTWGSGFGGRLGHGDQENQYIPKIVNIQSLFRDIACGNQHTAAIDENGYLYICGSESRNCSKQNILVPQKIPELKNRIFKKICAGQDITLALSQDGAVFVWGQNLYGKLGLDRSNLKAYQVQPNIIESLSSWNITDIICKYNHCMAIADNGDVYTWGAGGSGRLGHGNIETLIKPKKIKDNFQTNLDDAQGEGEKEDQDDNQQYDFLIQKVMNGQQLSTFKEITTVIQMENELSYISKLKLKEKIIQISIKQIQKYIKESKEQNILINKYENQINKIILQRRFQLKIQPFTISESHISPIIVNFMQVHEKVILALQCQPCYLNNLVSKLFNENSQSLGQVLTAISYLFQMINFNAEIEKRSKKIIIKRDQLLYINLCKIIIKQEVESTVEFEKLFGQSTPTCYFLKLFFKRELGSLVPEDLLNDIFKEIMEGDISRKSIYSILLEDIGKQEKLDMTKDKQLLFNDKRVKTIILQNANNLRQICTKIVNKVSDISNNLPKSFKVLLGYAKQCIEEKQWQDQEKSKNKESEFRQKIYNKLTVLLYKNLFFTIIQYPEKENMMMNINEVFRGNLQTLTIFLNFIAEKDTIQGSEIYLSINTFIKEKWERLQNNVVNLLGLNESIDEELALIQFESQFIIEEPIIQIPQNCYVELLKQFISNPDVGRINTITSDYLYDQLKILGNFSEISNQSQTDTKFNIKIPIKYMIVDDNYQLEKCEDCGSMLPQYLNIIKKLEDIQNKDDKDNSVLIEIKEESLEDPIDQITIFCRQPIKKIDCTDINKLQDQLKIKYDTIIKAENPQFELATYIKQAEKMVKILINKDYSLQQLLNELQDFYLKRIHHKIYLEKMNKCVESILQQQDQFLKELKSKQVDLEKYYTNSFQFKILFKYSYSESKSIQLLRIKEMINKKKDDAGFDLFPQGIVPEIQGSVKLTVLVKEQIIKRFTLQYNQNLLNNTEIDFFNTTNDGWAFHLMFKMKQIQTMLGRFTINNSQFSDLKRTANKQSVYAVPQLGIEFNTFFFLQFLQDKIQQHVF